MKIATSLSCVSLALVATACGSAPSTSPEMDAEAAAATIDADNLMRHVETLAADEFEGRSPGTEGDRLTVEYLVGEFESMGVSPGNPDGTYVQSVPLIGYEKRTQAWLETKGKKTELTALQDYVAVTQHTSPEVSVEDSPIVFVGYGVTAPEFDWDDYKNVDMTGKTLLMLVGDPAIPDPDDPSRLDDSMFGGKAMTYYGRWTYKYEIASKVGAAAAIVIHETGPAGYPWEVVSGSWGRESFDIGGQDRSGRVQVESWIPESVARDLLSSSGMDFDTLKQAALRPDFRPVPLSDARASFRLEVDTREINSHNVLGLVEGAHPERKDEYIIYTAHWDHLGRDPSLEGDQIFNGAKDNASGTAALLELARAFRSMQPAPDRSILFLAVTAEEKGLLGSKYYAANPLYPLERTVALLNMDALNVWGPTNDVECVGFGNSTLDDVLIEEASVQGRDVLPDSRPEVGGFYRSDHFSFAKRGVPALYVKSGVSYVGKPEGWGKTRSAAYTSNDYHKVSDEIGDDWDLTGTVQDAQLLFWIGYSVSQEPAFPEWKPGTEFAALRAEMLAR